MSDIEATLSTLILVVTALLMATLHFVLPMIGAWMTYQIPAGAYPKNWTSPPDPPKEREVAVQLVGGIEIQFEESMDPYEEWQVTEATQERLKQVAEYAKETGLCLDLKFDVDSIEDWDVSPEYLGPEMEERT